MLRQGPIPRFLHGVIEYAAGVLLIASSFLFGFEDSAATAVSIVAGVLVLVIAASTEGPSSLVNSIPIAVHVLLDYALVAMLVASPFLFGFEDGAATAVSIVVGVVAFIIAASTEGPSSLVDSIPIAVHVLLDYALAAVLIAAPFLFGFTDESAPTAFFIVLGVAHLLITIGTRFRAAKQA